MIIYKVTNLVNDKVYIGQTIANLEYRKNQHIRWAFNYNAHYIFHKALRKYGKENFNWEIIDTSETQEELNEKEIYWISFYKSYIYADKTNGYNMTIGGKSISGHKHAEETKKKISKGNKGKIRTEEQKQLNSEKQRGSRHSQAKLTEENVLEIKDLIKRGISIDKIATKFNVSYESIVSIKNGYSWSHTGEDVSYIEYSKITKSILTKEDVIKIKSLLKEGVKQIEVANIFNVDPTTISAIKIGKLWKEIGEDLSDINYHKLTENDVKEIKILIKNGELSQKEISIKFNVHPSNISDIKRGKLWKHVVV